MSALSITLQHGHSRDEAIQRLEHAVDQLQSRFTGLIREVRWTDDHSRVRMDGTGFWVEMTVDAENLHATGEIPALGGLISAGLKKILSTSFQKQIH
jgi:hypothetical protein